MIHNATWYQYMVWCVKYFHWDKYASITNPPNSLLLFAVRVRTPKEPALRIQLSLGDLYICHLNKVIETVMYVRNYSAKFLPDDASDCIVFLVYGWLHQQPLHHLHTLLSLFQDGNELRTCGSPSVSFNSCARGHSDSALWHRRGHQYLLHLRILCMAVYCSSQCGYSTMQWRHSSLDRHQWMQQQWWCNQYWSAWHRTLG